VSFRGPKRLGPARGTVSLVALCFTAVIGISLASYITLSSRAMQLSNRSFQASVSKQLAEVGLEEALRAFNKNDWDDWTSSGISTDWTLDTTNKRAAATMTFPAGKFGQGTTATVKIRVDNYDAARLGVSWSNSKTYRINDLVGYNGVWYRSVKDDNTNHTPGVTDLTWWVPAPIVWAWSSNTSYTAYQDIVCYNGSWWLCDTTHTSGTSFNWSNWTWVPAPDLAWSSWAPYQEGQYVYRTSNNTWYRCTDDHFAFGWDGSKFTVASWSYRASATYSFDDVVHYSGSWYRYINASSSSGVTPGSNAAYWENALSGSMHAWNSSLNYNLGDVAYHSGTSAWYRCIRANTGQTPSTSSAYWANTPLFSTDWESSKQYSQNDTVRYNGVWYLSIHSGTSNIAQNPSTATSYWIGANTSNASYTWNNATSYAVGAYRCYGGVWYRCVAATAANAGHTPNNPTYWTASWSNSWGLTTGAPVVYAEATVNIANSPSQKTQLRAPLAPAPLFPNAAGATGDLTITTATGTVDSYDYSLGTGYAAQVGNTTTNYSAVLAAVGNLAINGTTAVKGYLAASSLPSNISTGTTVKGPSSPASPNLAADRLSRSPYVPQFDVVPNGNLASATIWNVANKGASIPNPAASDQTLNLGIPGATTPARYYYDGDLRLESGSSSYYRYISVHGPVILIIKGSFRVQSSGLLQVNSAGSAQILYGSIFRIYSGGEIRNNTQDPKKLILLTDSTSTEQTFLRQNTASPKDFYGVIYSPKLGSSVGVEIENGVNIYGAVSAKEISFNDAANLHYDTSLRYSTFSGVDQPYAVTEWRELAVTERATMP
jgi:hypothetical protein